MVGIKFNIDLIKISNLTALLEHDLLDYVLCKQPTVIKMLIKKSMLGGHNILQKLYSTKA